MLLLEHRRPGGNRSQVGLDWRSQTYGYATSTGRLNA